MKQEYTPEQAARYLNVSEKKLETLISAQKLSIPITHKDLNAIKTQWKETSQQARTQLAELTRQYSMGY